MSFGDLPKYHHDGFFKKIEPLDPNKPIQPGDKFRNSMEIGTFEAVIKVRDTNIAWNQIHMTYYRQRRTRRHALLGRVEIQWCS